MGKIINILPMANREDNLQEIMEALQEVKDALVEVLDQYEEEGAQEEADTLTEALDALEDAYDVINDVVMDEIQSHWGLVAFLCPRWYSNFINIGEAHRKTNRS